MSEPTNGYRSNVLWSITLLIVTATVVAGTVGYHTRDIALTTTVAGIPTFLVMQLFNILKTAEAAQNAKEAVKASETNTGKLDRVEAKAVEAKDAAATVKTDLAQAAQQSAKLAMATKESVDKLAENMLTSSKLGVK